MGKITCARYKQCKDSKRCRWYIKNGACALPDEFMCVEWLKLKDAEVST